MQISAKQATVLKFTEFILTAQRNWYHYYLWEGVDTSWLCVLLTAVCSYTGRLCLEFARFHANWCDQYYKIAVHYCY